MLAEAGCYGGRWWAPDWFGSRGRRGLEPRAAVASLAEGFQNPPDTAKPRTWWHWNNGDVTQDGITKDLEWMKRAGIGGFQLSDVGYGQGGAIAKPLAWGSPEWYDAVRHAAAEAKRLGLEMAIFSSGGWSETGGPWVKPADAMKKYVWSTTQTHGPDHFDAELSKPPATIGIFQNLGSSQGFYADSRVIAFPTPGDADAIEQRKPTVTVNGLAVDAGPLLDDDWNSGVDLRSPGGGEPIRLQLAFAAPFTARAITLAGRGRRAGIPSAASSRATTARHGARWWRCPASSSTARGRSGPFAFPETTARFFRIELTGEPLDPGRDDEPASADAAARFRMTAAQSCTPARASIAGKRRRSSASCSNTRPFRPCPVDDAAVIPTSGVVDLTDKMSADGHLDWDVPQGTWTILRLGESQTGGQNRPARPALWAGRSTSSMRQAVTSYYHGYFDPLRKALGPLYGGSLSAVVMDSWEAGMDNWTEDWAGGVQAAPRLRSDALVSRR